MNSQQPYIIPYEPLASQYPGSDLVTEKNLADHHAASRAGRPANIRQSLRIYVLLACSIAAFNWVIGGLAIATYFRRGPLHSAQIPIQTLSGSVLNPANLAALIAGSTGVLAALAHVIQAAISRSWLLRKSSSGAGMAVREWQAVASGGGIRRLLRSPRTAGGIPLILIVSAGLMSSTWTGVLVPVRKLNDLGGSFMRMPGYIGNAGVGDLSSCIDPGSFYSCPTLRFGLVTWALSWGASYVGQGTTIQIQSQGVDIDSRSLAGMPLLVHNGTAGAIVPQGTKLSTIRGPGLRIAVSCSRLAGGISTDGSYVYESNCYSTETTPLAFGNATDLIGTYTTSVGCVGDDKYIFEYAIGNSALTGTMAFTCNITANEGILSTHIDGAKTSFDEFDSGQDLTGQEVGLFGSALVAAVLQDGAVYGKKGYVGEAMIDSVIVNGTADMDIAKTIVGNAAAAAAVGGYFQLSISQAMTGWKYVNLHSGWWTGHIESYGWIARWSILIWGIVAVLLGLGWMISGIYLTKGGTEYDPTEWFDSVNTAAGSSLLHIDNDQTGNRRPNDDLILWYGDIGKGYPGFSNSSTTLK